MTALLPLAIGLGLVMSLLFSELFGLAAGGMVVPGYVALYLGQPVSVAITLLAGWLTFVVIQGLSSVVILYGRRRTALTILVGYMVGAGVRMALGQLGAGGPEMDVIGFIVPGLIALWIARQGVVPTMSAIVTVAILVRLALIVLVGEELHT